MPLVSDTAGAYARLGVIYLTQHEFREAYDAARRAVAWNSNNQEALGLLFDAAMATGRYAVAESTLDRKSTRMNSSHDQISYAVFCLKKKKTNSYWHSSVTFNSMCAPDRMSCTRVVVH